MFGREAAELGFSDALRLESDVEMLLRISVNGSESAGGLIEADRQLNEFERLLASFEGRWKSSREGEIRSFGDRRNEEEVRQRPPSVAVAVGVVDGGMMEIWMSGDWLDRFESTEAEGGDWWCWLVGQADWAMVVDDGIGQLLESKPLRRRMDEWMWNCWPSADSMRPSLKAASSSAPISVNGWSWAVEWCSGSTRWHNSVYQPSQKRVNELSGFSESTYIR